jgi:DNA polymerase-3 subunit alpha
MAENSVRFMEGCRRKGLTKDQATQLWELILPFAGYSFNLSHAVLYGRLTYQTAYLKHHYPVEYMAAVLTGTGGVTEDVAKAVTETRRLGVAVLPPDVNVSNQGFTIIDLPGEPPPGVNYQLGVRFGLGAIKNVGLGPVEALIRARDEGGPFRSLEDLCARVERSALNKRTVESLIKAGALDTLPGTRRQKLAILDAAVSAGVETQKARESGQESLFGDLFGGGDAPGAASISAIPLPVISESPADKKETLLWEKELLGTNVSEDPVMQALEGIDTAGAMSLGQLSEEHIGKKLDFVGMLSGTRKIMTKKGDSMLVGTLEDMQSSIEFVAFPRALEKFKDLLVDDGVVRVNAKVDNRRDALQLMIESASAPLYRAAAPATPALDPAALSDMLRISVPSSDAEPLDDGPEMDALAVAVEALPATLGELPTHGPSSYGNGGNGHASGYASGGNGHRPVASNGSGGAGEPPPASVSVIRPRAKVTISASAGDGGSGGGGSNGGGGGDGGNSGRHLRLFLPRSGDFDADVQRMQELDQLLRSTEGDDQVTIYLPEASGTVLLRPKHTVNAAPALLGDLRQILGEQGVILE